MTFSPTYIVDFEPLGRSVTVKAGTSLLEAARKAGIDLMATCDGQGSCGLCCVSILGGQVSAISQDEEFNMSEADLDEHHRLACCARVYSPVVVHIPDDSITPVRNALMEGDNDDGEENRLGINAG